MLRKINLLQQQVKHNMLVHGPSTTNVHSAEKKSSMTVVDKQRLAQRVHHMPLCNKAVLRPRASTLIMNRAAATSAAAASLYGDDARPPTTIQSRHNINQPHSGFARDDSQEVNADALPGEEMAVLRLRASALKSRAAAPTSAVATSLDGIKATSPTTVQSRYNIIQPHSGFTRDDTQRDNANVQQSNEVLPTGSWRSYSARMIYHRERRQEREASCRS